MNSEQNQPLCRRHCMVVHAYYPLGETRVERQAMALRDHGIEVDVVCLRAPGDSSLETVDGVQVYRLPVRRHKRSGLIVQLFEYLAFLVLASIRVTTLFFRRRYQTIQIHNLPDFLVFAALIPKLAGAKIILDLHDLMPEFYAERIETSLESLPVRFVRWQERVCCRFADHVITVTELWRQALVERGQPPEKISVVMNVADDRIFNQEVNATVSGNGSCDMIQSQAADERFRLVYHGTMEKRHGVDLALRALSLVRQTAPEIQLILHGGRWKKNEFAGLVHELGLQDHVEFSLGFVPTEQLPKLLMKADLGVVPYRNGVFTGGILPTKLMEYAALGIPAIAARTPAIAAYFDETTVQFFTPGNVEELAGCILTLYRDRTRLAELAHNIARFNERHNWPDQQRSYLELIDQLTKG